MTAATFLVRLACAWFLISLAWFLYAQGVKKLREMREERADADAQEAAEQAEWLATMRSPENDRAAVAQAFAQWNRGIRG